MKKIIIILFLIFAGFSLAMAQDIISLKSGEDIKATIIRLDPNDVIFIEENSADTVFLHRDDISRLTYKSGIIIVLGDTEVPENIEGQLNDSLFTQGQADAGMYYKGYRPAAVGTMITSIYFPFGLIPAIACSTKPPAMKNLGYRDQQLMENASYYNGYIQKAHQIKKKKVWGGFAIGTGFIIGLVIFTSVAAATF